MAKEQWPDWDVYLKGRCRCVYCGLDGTENFHAWRQMRIDHLIPRAGGGEDSAVNKVVCCVDCNFKKGQFNPRTKLSPAATRVSPPDPAIRLRLIEAVKEQIQPRLAEEQCDYRTMTQEIKGCSPPNVTLTCSSSFSVPVMTRMHNAAPSS